MADTFTWRGEEVACLPNSIDRGAVVVVGGKEVTVQFSLYVLFDNFFSVDSTLVTVDDTLSFTDDENSVRPVAGRTLVFRGRTYRIFSVREDATRAYYKLILVDQHSGR